MVLGLGSGSVSSTVRLPDPVEGHQLAYQKCETNRTSSLLDLGFEVGDASVFGGARSVDATDRLVTPALVAAARGWRARRWLDGAALDRLARHGVAVVYWQVPSARLHQAAEMAAALDRPGRARLDPRVGPPPAATIALDRAPGAPPPGATLGELLAALSATAAPGSLPSPAGRLPPLRPGVSASFLILAPASGDASRSDPALARLEAAWIDGFEHEQKTSFPWLYRAA